MTDPRDDSVTMRVFCLGCSRSSHPDDLCEHGLCWACDGECCG